VNKVISAEGETLSALDFCCFSGIEVLFGEIVRRARAKAFGTANVGFLLIQRLRRQGKQHPIWNERTARGFFVGG
jgi:hypothetical protein